VRRVDLAHIIRAVSTQTRDLNVVIFGSQAILGSFDETELPQVLVVSREADVTFLDDPHNIKSDSVEGAIGEESSFDRLHGYYASGVSISTADLPTGWQQRLVEFRGPSTAPGTGWCLEPHDLALAKLSAGREKDMPYVAALIDAGLVSVATLRERLTSMPISGVGKRRIATWLDIWD
jgi:hypothetical protein